MSETKGNVLIVSLGKSPGVVTSAVDVLAKERVKVNKVVTITTQSGDTCSKDRKGNVFAESGGYVEFLISEFETYPEYKDIEYIYDCNDSCDIENKSECDDFLQLAVKHIRNYKKEGYGVYVCIAGGRKSMSALLTIAVQFFGAKALFHVAITDRQELSIIDDYSGNLTTLRGDKGKKILHPESAEIVPLPFCDISQFIPTKLDSTEGSGLLDALLRFCEKSQGKHDRDIPANDPAELK